MKRFDAFIAAGGFAERLGGGRPKSLIAIDGVSLLELTVRAALSAGARTTYVMTNRAEFVSETQAVVSSFRNVIVVPDKGYSNTLQLARATRSKTLANTLFLYGHAPRPLSLLTALLEGKRRVNACAFPASSRRHPIASGDRRLEPPFLLEPGLLEAEAEQWCDLFTSLGSGVGVIHTDDAPEFNIPEEADLYFSYIRSLGAGAFGMGRALQSA